MSSCVYIIVLHYFLVWPPLCCYYCMFVLFAGVYDCLFVSVYCYCSNRDICLFIKHTYSHSHVYINSNVNLSCTMLVLERHSLHLSAAVCDWRPPSSDLWLTKKDSSFSCRATCSVSHTCTWIEEDPLYTIKSHAQAFSFWAVGEMNFFNEMCAIVTACSSP